MMRLRTGGPHASMRLLRALACGAGAVLLAAAAIPTGNDGAVVSLSVEPTSGRAQVVIGIDGEFSVRDFALKNPDRIVIDITGATLGVKRGGYDRIARGGVLDVRYAQNQPNVVRVVLTLAGERKYQVERDVGAIRVSVDGGGAFRAWRVGQAPVSAPSLAKAKISANVDGSTASTFNAPRVYVAPGFRSESNTTARVIQVSQDPVPREQQPAQQPVKRITITYENANITDVLAGFAALTGRTIIPSKNVTGTVSAEIVDQPWDVALRAILRANGFDITEDENGILIVNTQQATATQTSYLPLVTRTVRFNYTSASAVAEALRERLSRDCGSIGGAEGQAGAQAAAGQAAALRALSGGAGGTVDLRCPQRGAVTFDTLTNSVSITDVETNMEDIIAYSRTLDLRQPQVNIKAKIILVDRSQLEGLGLKYDLGSPRQHFNDVVARIDSTGEPETGTTIALGGNTISAIANAATAVPSATLSLVYSAAIGAFSFTSFFDALQTTNLLDVQAEPSVTTLNYRTANLSAGTQVPVRVIEAGAGANAAGAQPRATVQMRQTGIVLNVTPSITNNRQVRMRVHAENSDVAFQSGDVGAVFPTQSIDNELLVADGETAVMGGLTQTSVTYNRTGIPILVDLPLIGRLFGVTTRNETKRDLLILITPHIVDEGDMTMEPRRTP